MSEDSQLSDKTMFFYELNLIFDSPSKMMPSYHGKIFKCSYNFHYYSYGQCVQDLWEEYSMYNQWAVLLPVGTNMSLIAVEIFIANQLYTTLY